MSFSWKRAHLLFLCALSITAGESIDYQEKGREGAVAIWDDLVDFLSIPNFAPDTVNINKNIDWLHGAFQKRGFETRTLATEGNSLFFAQMNITAAKRTILFYMHFDGQAVDPAEWDQDDPYKPVLKGLDDNSNWKPLGKKSIGADFNDDWRLFCRSASDDKSPIVMFLAGLDILKSMGVKPAYNIKVILDSEEESGSPHLAPAVKRYRDLLAADQMLILDGPRHVSNKPTLLFGCRGIATLNLKVYGPKVPQHSGHYGNYAPNPGFLLADLLASMKDDYGRVLISGFYDGVHLDAATKAVLATVPDNEETIRRKIGIAEPDRVGGSYQESIQYPSLNIMGIKCAWVGKEARTIVPGSAEAVMDIRLVPETDGTRLLELVKEHIRSQGFHLVNGEPTDEERARYKKLISLDGHMITNAFRTDPLSPFGQWIISRLETTCDVEPILIRMTGGSVPIAHFITELKIPAVIVPLVNPDNNQHSPNENLRLGNLAEGIQICIGILNP